MRRRLGSALIASLCLLASVTASNIATAEEAPRQAPRRAPTARAKAGAQAKPGALQATSANDHAPADPTPSGTPVQSTPPTPPQVAPAAPASTVPPPAVVEPAAGPSHHDATAEAPRAAGPRVDAKGISLGLPAGGGPTFGFSYGVAERLSLRLDVGLDIHKGAAPDDNVLVGFSLDAGARFYVWESGALHAFAQPGIFFAKQAAHGDFGELSSVAAVGSLGAEYFFVPQLSVSGATGLSLKLSSDFKDVRVSTGTSALYANFYW